MKDYVFASESVSEGHPDKVCDRISDAIVDAYLAKDPTSRIAVETLATTNRVIVSGEVRGHLTNQEIEEITRNAIKEIGYMQDNFHWETAKIENHIHEQSADIAMGVDAKEGSASEGAGDQGIMFGFAVNETPEYMPAPILYSHKILYNLAQARHSGELSMLLPDAKSQVSLQYEDGHPVGCTSVVVSTQHVEGLSPAEVKEIVRPYVLGVLPKGWMCPEDKFYVNPTGRFVIGGPDGDTGLTGRKIIVDTYGGACPHGGGAFSGKDPTKVDRSAAYITRYLAKNIVAAGLADKCTIQLSYAIGVAEPLSIYVDFHGTGRVDSSRLAKDLREMVDLTPAGIRKHLDLARPIYTPTSSYGHFGRTPLATGEFSWEKLDLVGTLQSQYNMIKETV